MKIYLEQVSKRFRQYRIFSNVTYTFGGPGSYALLGANGSGKSTLMRILGGIQAPSTGNVRFEDGNLPVSADKIFSSVSICAPGVDIVEELTLKEFMEFHFSFKKPISGLRVPDIIQQTGLAKVAGKPIIEFSSGMKQRVKLAQAIFSDTPILLLDEPCTNLDAAGVDQYRLWIQQYTAGRLVIVASNDPREYDFCKELISIEDYK